MIIAMMETAADVSLSLLKSVCHDTDTAGKSREFI